jgi:hypothetical protein
VARPRLKFSYGHVVVPRVGPCGPVVVGEQHDRGCSECALVRAGGPRAVISPLWSYLPLRGNRWGQLSPLLPRGACTWRSIWQ